MIYTTTVSTTGSSSYTPFTSAGEFSIPSGYSNYIIASAVGVADYSTEMPFIVVKSTGTGGWCYAKSNKTFTIKLILKKNS